MKPTNGARLAHGLSLAIAWTTWAVLIASRTPLPAVDFVRGDINGDGAVSIADIYFLSKYLAWYGPPPECWQAADADNDGDVDWTDVGRIDRLLFLDGAPLDPPFPAAGPAGPPMGHNGWLNCASSGNGAPLDDPAAKLEILDSTAQGGADGLAKIILAISSSVPVAGCSWSLRFDGNVFERTNACDIRDLTRSPPVSFCQLPLQEGRLLSGYLPGPTWLEAGESIQALELTLCLKEGLLPGDYPLILEAGELVHSDSGRAIHPLLVSGTLTVRSGLNPGAGCPPDPSVGGADFVRGDANSDGTVSISDAYFILNYLFIGGWPPECMFAADANNNGQIQLTDAMQLLKFLVDGDLPPPAPFPDPGPEDGGNGFWSGNWDPCPSYGNGKPLEDPAAKLEVLDAVAAGGEESMVTITVALSSSASLAGYSGTILADPAIFRSGAHHKGKDLTGTFRDGFNSNRIHDGLLKFGFLATLTSVATIPAGQNVSVLEINACLKEGTPLGQYPLALAAGELVDAYSGQAIHPVLEGGTLTVLSQVSEGVACAGEEYDSNPPVPATPPPPPVEPHVQYKLLGASAAPGATASVPFILHANVPVQGLSFSVDFDEEVLRLQALKKLSDYPDTTQGFERLEVNNRNNNPGSAGVDEGFIVGGVVFSLQADITLPVNKDNFLLELEFLLEPDAQVEATEVRFLDGGQGTGWPVANTVTVDGNNFLPEEAGSYIFTNGVVSVLPEITTFVRGDSNGNGAVDISDVLHTLGYLFLGTARPACYDAADADDSGQINLGDPILTLTFLFLGKGQEIPPPFPAPGEDPTPDRLGCLHVY